MVLLCFVLFLIIQSQAANCKLPIRSEIYNCTFKNTNKVSIIIIIYLRLFFIIIILIKTQEQASFQVKKKKGAMKTSLIVNVRSLKSTAEFFFSCISYHWLFVCVFVCFSSTKSSKSAVN